MKIRHLKVSAVLLAATLLTSSCVGSFALFNKLAGWNKQATDNKFLNELIFILISPAYADVPLLTCSSSTLSSSGQAATRWRSA